MRRKIGVILGTIFLMGCFCGCGDEAAGNSDVEYNAQSIEEGAAQIENEENHKREANVSGTLDGISYEIYFSETIEEQRHGVAVVFTNEEDVPCSLEGVLTVYDAEGEKADSCEISLGCVEKGYPCAEGFTAIHTGKLGNATIEFTKAEPEWTTVGNEYVQLDYQISGCGAEGTVKNISADKELTHAKVDMLFFLEGEFVTYDFAYVEGSDKWKLQAGESASFNSAIDREVEEVDEVICYFYSSGAFNQ